MGVLGLVLSMMGSASAGDVNWTNTAGGNYTNSLNWNPNTVPGSGDNPLFKANGSYQVDWTGSITNLGTVRFDAVQGTVTQAIGSARWTVTNAYIALASGVKSNTVVQTSGTWEIRDTLQVGVGNYQNRAAYILTGGSLLSKNLYMGYGTNNLILITGSGSTVTNTGALNIGFSGSRDFQFVISNGASVVATGVDGFNSSVALGTSDSAQSGHSLLVTGSNSVLKLTGNLRLQQGTNMLVTIADGGLVQAAQTYVGYSANLQKSVDHRLVVTGAGSVLTNTSDLYLGRTGGGVASTSGSRLVITNGGRVFASGFSSGFDGASPSNRTEVVGANSRLDISGTLHAGYASVSNSLFVRDGGAVSAPTLNVGSLEASSNNLVQVEGAASTVVATNATKTGLVNILRGALTMNGGTVTADTLLATNGSMSVFNLNAGTLNIKASTVVSNGSAFAVGDGTQAATLNLVGGTHSFKNGLSVLSNATLKGIGTNSSSVTIFDGGILAPGSSPGTMIFNSNLTFSGGSILNFELGPHNASGVGFVGLGSNDLVVVNNGTLTLDGLLNVTALDGFGPFTGSALTNVFRLFNYTGGFVDNGLTLNSLPANTLAWLDTSVGGQVNLYFAVPEPGTGAMALFATFAFWCVRRQRKHI